MMGISDESLFQVSLILRVTWAALTLHFSESQMSHGRVLRAEVPWSMARTDNSISGIERLLLSLGLSAVLNRDF